MTEKSIFYIYVFRMLALLTAVIGAFGSLYFVIHAGRNQHSFLLIALFVVWALSPFVLVVYLNRRSTRWPINPRKSFYFLTILLTIVSLAAYGGALSFLKLMPAFLFLVVPLISLVSVMVVIWSAQREKKEDLNRQ